MSAWFLNIISEFLKNHFFTGNQFSWGKTSIAGVILAAVLLLLRKIWKKLEPRFVNWVSQSILNIVHSISPGFYRRYRKKIIMSHDSFNVKGLGLIASYSLNLTDVFVELKISASKNPQETAKHFLDTQDSKNARDIWDFIRITEKKDTKRKSYAIIGAPGSGKTTLLQNVAITLLNNRHKRHKIRRYTPTLLFLRDYADKIKNDNPPLSELLDKHFSDKKLFPTLKPPPKWFENKLIRGKCIVLLDGLDEVGDLDKRKAVSAWVDNQINNYPDCLFIITSRPLGYLKAPLTNINVLELCNFTAGQVRSFISKWYLENEIKSAGNVNNEKVKELAKTWTEYLLQGLRQIPALIELTVNPLLLTMIAMVHKFHGKLPGSRYELYKEMCEVMLGRWRQTKGIEEEFSAGKKRFILVPLACHMMKNKLREIPINDAVTLLRQDLKKIGVKDKEEENFFKNLHETSGILIEKETGILSFAHLTFQEYLTASCLPKNSDWAQLITDSWWHETIRLYCAQGDATEIIKSCLNEKSISSLLFALECAEEAERVNADIRQELNDIIFNNLESDDKKLFKVAAEVILNKRLKSFTKIDETREISTSFITCAEYQLFIDDMKKDGIYIKPDHWLDDKFPTGIANMELTGITLTDSLRFCKWLTDKSNGIFFYRLLTEKEARSYVSETDNISSWTLNKGNLNIYGLNAETIKAFHRTYNESLDSNIKIEYNLKQFISDEDMKILPSFKNNLSVNITFIISVLKVLDKNPTFEDYYDYIRNQANALVLDLNFVRYLDIAVNLDIASTLADLLARHNVFLRAYMRFALRIFFRGIDLDYAHSRVLNSMLVRTKVLANALTYNLDNSYKYALSLIHNLDLAHDDLVGIDFYSVISHAFDNDHTSSFLAIAFDFNCTIDIKIIRNLYDILAKQLNNQTLMNTLKNDDYSEAIEIIMSLKKEATDKELKTISIVERLIHILRAKDKKEEIIARRNYSALLYEYIYVGMDDYIKIYKQKTKWKFLNLLTGNVIPSFTLLRLQATRRMILEFYYWNKLTILRLEDKLSAWEGILLARERK